MITITKLLVKHILEKADQYDWSLQGFGMLRLYLSPEICLQIWDDRYRVPDVSDIHDHPWSFTSLIVAGRLTNRIWQERPDGRGTQRVHLQPGPGGGPIGTSALTGLIRLSEHVYSEGESYAQHSAVIHQTLFENGTVTIIDRFDRASIDEANSYHQANLSWVSAEPRPATAEEVQAITCYALKRWF